MTISGINPNPKCVFTGVWEQGTYTLTIDTDVYKIKQLYISLKKENLAKDIPISYKTIGIYHLKSSFESELGSPNINVQIREGPKGLFGLVSVASANCVYVRHSLMSFFNDTRRASVYLKLGRITEKEICEKRAKIALSFLQEREDNSYAFIQGTRVKEKPESKLQDASGSQISQMDQ